MVMTVVPMFVGTILEIVDDLTSFFQYAYSAWAPQFADRMHLTATQSNIIVRTTMQERGNQTLRDRRAMQETSECTPLAYLLDGS